MNRPSTIPLDPELRKGVPAAPSVADHTIAQYLIRRLMDYGIGHVFGIPGDYVLSFYTELERSPLEVVGCTREDCAGFAADAYARVNGMGAVCVTYCVGGFSLCNSIAGAYAEKSPVVLITGSPGLRERYNNPLLHHRVRDFRTQLEVFEKLCIAGTELNDAALAFREIDRVLDAAARYKRPVYIEIPRDMVNVVPDVQYQYEQPQLESDPQALAEAVAEAAGRLGRCTKPIIVAGVEIHRFGLQDKILELAEASQIPLSATMLGKSVIRETHPLYVGLYEGAMGDDAVTSFVEDSDCVLLMGTYMSDINLGIYTANLDPGVCIYATSESLRIGHHHYHNVLLEDFVRDLCAAKPAAPQRVVPKTVDNTIMPFEIEPDRTLTITRMIARLNQSLDEDTIVIADIGDSLFAATELVTRGRTEFISPAYYTTMGFSVPAAVGAKCARPGSRTVVIAGDGAFQMTGCELATLIRRGQQAIVIVLNNEGYGTERVLHAGDWEFNEIPSWAYHKLPEVFGGGTGYEVRTEGEFDAALSEAWDSDSLSLIHVHLPRDDCSQALQRLADRLKLRV
ncbi:MAG: alpha-keto acid decarboxylase family protein [Planctomycetales bacterium]|nr:alpha-keto acid decarboxylase family protein [Planctomycetales bacterium]NIP70406.1 alpha-keto acid decarboxylase family protein [Planctomycetales bacterium]